MVIFLQTKLIKKKLDIANLVVSFFQRLILSLAILSVLQFNVCVAQSPNGWGLTTLFSIVRYQNTACETPDGEAGTCVLEQECNNRQGQINKGCPTTALVCCVSKVSKIRIKQSFNFKQ